MKLSRKAIRILKWMNRNDEPKYPRGIEADCKDFEERAFKALLSAGLIMQCPSYDVVLDSDQYEDDYRQYEYQIADAGKALLETRAFTWLPELRGWVAILISACALVVSIITLALKLMQLC